MSRFTTQSDFRERPRDANPRPVLTGADAIGGDGGAIAGAIQKLIGAASITTAQVVAEDQQRTKAHQLNNAKFELVDGTNKILEDNDLTPTQQSKMVQEHFQEVLGGLTAPGSIGDFMPEATRVAISTNSALRARVGELRAIEGQRALDNITLTTDPESYNESIRSLGLGDIAEAAMIRRGDIKYSELKLKQFESVASMAGTKAEINAIAKEVGEYSKYVGDSEARDRVFGKAASEESYRGTNRALMEAHLSKVDDPVLKETTRARFDSHNAALKGADRVSSQVARGSNVTGTASDFRAYDEIVMANRTRSEATKYKIDNKVPITEVDRDAIGAMLDRKKNWNPLEAARSLMWLPSDMAEGMAKRFDTTHFAEALYSDIRELDKAHPQYEAFLAQRVDKFNHPDADKALELANDKIIGNKNATFRVGNTVTKKDDTVPYGFKDYARMFGADNETTLTPDLVEDAQNALRVLMIENRTQPGASNDTQRLLDQSFDQVAIYLGKRMIRTQGGRSQRNRRAISRDYGTLSDAEAVQLEAEIRMATRQFLGITEGPFGDPFPGEGRPDIPLIDGDDMYTPIMVGSGIAAYAKFVPEETIETNFFGGRKFNLPGMVMRGDKEFKRLSAMHASQISGRDLDPDQHLQRPRTVPMTREKEWDPTGNLTEDITQKAFDEWHRLHPEGLPDEDDKEGNKRVADEVRALRDSFSKGKGYDGVEPLNGPENDTGTK